MVERPAPMVLGPFVGVGPDRLLELHAADGSSAHFVHNEYLQVAADAGLVGVGLLGLVALSLARALRRTGPLSSCAVAAVVCWAVGGLFDFSWHLPVVGLVGGWCAGLAVPRGVTRMRSLLVALAVVATVALSVGLPASPAAAASTTSTAVFDQATNSGWAGTEVTGATAYDTATVAGDGTQPPAGTVTYSFFDNGTCTTDPNTTTDTEAVTAGVAQNSTAQGPLAAGTYSFDATYNGDGDNSASDPSSCESFTVGPATPSVALHVLDSSDQPWTNGQTGTDAGASSSVTGVSGFTPGGSVPTRSSTTARARSTRIRPRTGSR